MKGRIVVVTGASGGIGAELAVLLSARGAVPVLLARRTDKLAETAARLAGEHAIYPLDVTSTEQVTAVMDDIRRRYGAIDVLVNNAGFAFFEPFAEAPLEHFERMMDVNYMGVVRCTKAVLPDMLKRGKGHIVNIASLAGKIGTAKSTGYSASKHAVIGFTNCLRMELRGTGVFVTSVNPGPVDTPFFDIADPHGTYALRIRRFMLKPERVAEAIIRAIERRKAEVDLPWWGALGVKWFHLFPRSFESLAGRLLDIK